MLGDAPDQAARVHFGRSGRSGALELAKALPSPNASVGGGVKIREGASDVARPAPPNWQQLQSPSKSGAAASLDDASALALGEDSAMQVSGQYAHTAAQLACSGSKVSRKIRSSRRMREIVSERVSLSRHWSGPQRLPRLCNDGAGGARCERGHSYFSQIDDQTQ